MFLSAVTQAAVVSVGSAGRIMVMFGMHRNAAAAADFLNLPSNRIVELGAKVEI